MISPAERLSPSGSFCERRSVMETEKPTTNGVSKRVSVSMAAISAIAASQDFRAQIVIGLVALAFVISDTLLNYFRGRRHEDQSISPEIPEAPIA